MEKKNFGKRYPDELRARAVRMEAGVLEKIVGRLLNHTPLSITGQRYMRLGLDALRPSMELVCEELQSRVNSIVVGRSPYASRAPSRH